MNILDYKLYYFLGVGGIGMSALARFFNHHGKTVVGYDKTATVLTKALESEGIDCHYSEEVDTLQAVLKDFQPHEVLVVYTPAVPVTHAEYVYLLKNNYRILKRSQVLGAITEGYKTIAIGGTHGKTTTTTMVAHILKEARLNITAFMGGISQNYATNLLLGEAGDENMLVVVEADEYDRSFLTLSPYIALITSCDADHLDIYGDASSVVESYRLFSQRVRKDGVLVVKKNVDNEIKPEGSRLIYSLNLNTEYQAHSIRVEDGFFVFGVQSPVQSIDRVVLGLPGLHNVENATAAIAIVQKLGVASDVIVKALRSFRGVKRRFDFRYRSAETVLVDDYAHHPEELKATIGAARQLFPGRQITGVFQPHLFSRTRDFADAFAASLSLLDECILLDIYPAREQPIPGITSEWLAEKMTTSRVKVMNRESALEELKINGRDILLTMGAGNIDALADQLAVALENRK